MGSSWVESITWQEWDLMVTSGAARDFSFQRNLSNQLSSRAQESRRAGRASLLRFRVVAELPAGCHGDTGHPGGACALEEGTGPVSGMRSAHA